VSSDDPAVMTGLEDTDDLFRVPLLGNRVDRFEWTGSALNFDRAVIKLRSFQHDGAPVPPGQNDSAQPPRGNHDGGVVAFGRTQAQHRRHPRGGPRPHVRPARLALQRPGVQLEVRRPPAAIGFMAGDGLGRSFSGDLFVCAATPLTVGGYLFHFNLTGNRRSVAVDDARLEDRVADNTAKHDLTESERLLIGRDFGVGTDIETGPNGTCSWCR
jgi:hypothetical protein